LTDEKVIIEDVACLLDIEIMCEIGLALDALYTERKAGQKNSPGSLRMYTSRFGGPSIVI